jgi:ketosteroid isomerase-like protein
MQPVETIRAFYASLAAGDAKAALGLMADDIAWTAMWHYQAKGSGPQAVAEGVLMPLMAEWSSFAMTPDRMIVEADTVVSLGRFTATHGATGKSVEAGYAHVWTVRDGRIAAFRQFIDTLAVAEARRP